MKSFLSLLFSSLIMSQAIATTQHYAIIVDAGSSGSRLHLFQYERNANLPIIHDIFTEKNSTPLASFANNPLNAGSSLKPLLDSVVKKLADENISEMVPIAVLGTAGMRLLTQTEQKAIYKNVTDYLLDTYSFPVKNVKTLSGKKEGLYDWLEVNYLKNNFQKNKKTLGSIDMGGASTQIAFETHDPHFPKDEEHVTVNHKKYLVFSKSFLGLGLDQSRMSISSYPLSDTCYPLNYPTKESLGHFNFETCDSLYSQIIGKYHVADEILPISPDQSFIAFSGAFYVYNFFESAETPDETFFLMQIKNVCQHTWEQLKQIYPNEQDAYLSGYCANGVYLQNLFYQTYRLTGSQLQVVNSINQQSIDWTLGALLYELVN